MAVSELITADHSVLSVSHFLESFRYTEGTLYGFSNIVIDLLLSFLKVYIGETLSDYLIRCFDIIIECLKNNKDTKQKSIIHAPLHA